MTNHQRRVSKCDRYSLAANLSSGQMSLPQHRQATIRPANLNTDAIAWSCSSPTLSMDLAECSTSVVLKLRTRNHQQSELRRIISSLTDVSQIMAIMMNNARNNDTMMEAVESRCHKAGIKFSARKSCRLIDIICMIFAPPNKKKKTFRLLRPAQVSH